MRIQTELFDGWTLVHAGAGYLARKAGIPQPTAMALAIIYEFLEQPVLASEEGRTFFDASGPEGIGNQIVDVAAFWVGYQSGRPAREAQ